MKKAKDSRKGVSMIVIVAAIILIVIVVVAALYVLELPPFEPAEEKILIWERRTLWNLQSIRLELGTSLGGR